MHLRRVDLENVGPYEAGSIDLPPTGLVLVVGPNNAGKSALLRAFDMLLVDGTVPIVPRSGANGPARATFTFQLTDAERARVLDGEVVATTQRLRQLRIGFEERPPSSGAHVAAVDVSDDRGTLRPYAQVKWSDALGAAWNEGELLHVPNWPAFFRGVGDPVVWELAVGSSGAVGQTLTGLNASVVAPLRPLLEGWRQNYFHFDPNRIGTNERRPVRGDNRLSPSGDNLPEALLYIFSRGLPAWTAIRDVMNDVVPDVGTLVVPVDQGEVWVAFEDPFLSVQHNLKSLGTGVEQVLMTTYVGECSEPGSTVIVEEPESHLHPEGQRRLLSHLLRWGLQRLVIASTHSTVFLDRAVDRQLPVWLVSRDAGVSTVRQASTALPDVLRAIGVRLSDVLSAERVLLAEGDSDVDVLRTWFGDQLRLAGVDLVASRRGGMGAWQIDAFREWLETSDVLKRKVCFLRDRDELDEASIERLEATDGVRVLRRREIENYLADPEAVHRVLAERHEGDPPSVEELTDAMAAAADALKSTVVLKRVASSLPSIRPMDFATLDKLAAGGADVDRLVEAVERRLPEFDWGDEIRRRWVEEESRLESSWASDWMSIAPGEELLDAAFSLAGQRYRKGRDALRLAETMTAPTELAETMQEVIGLLTSPAQA